MSSKYPGGIISKTAPVPSGPYADSTAPGIWTLDQQAAYAKQGNWPTAGNVNPSAFIENLFSTYLYTGTGADPLVINNGINLAGNGGLLWIKSRSSAFGNVLLDTARGPTSTLNSNSTAAASTAIPINGFTSTGFSLSSNSAAYNGASATYASWTFREQPKFFDVVTYTGNGTAGRTVAHNLGSAPGCMIVKATVNGAFGPGTYGWQVYHQSLGATKKLILETTAAESNATDRWNSTAPTSSVFTLGDAPEVNESGVTYIAYLFAHNAGGFGLTGTDNVISCGSFTTNGSGIATVSLGYEPQWVLIKQSNGVDSWYLNDNMRGMAVTGNNSNLSPNNSDAEAENGYNTYPSATGFTGNGLAVSATYIYIAIRRGPMAVPTDGTKVFTPVTTSASTGTAITTNFPVDLQMLKYRTGAQATMVLDRLRGISSSTTEAGVFLQTSNANTEVADNTVSRYWNNTGYQVASGWTLTDQVNWNFRRAPSFFDEVCFTTISSANQRISHNLGVAPELILMKGRDLGADWTAYYPGGALNKYLVLNSTAASTTTAGYNFWGASNPSSTDFGLNVNDTFGAGYNFVAYLFATCPGVSKVGSYTGTGATQTIACGFTGGARFVLIKRTNSTGSWYVWDTARGMVSGTDPSLLLNSTAAEVNANSIYTATGGFQIVSTAAGINASGGTYIFLAIA